MDRNEFARLIGEICIAWADLEHAVGFVTKVHLPSGPPINHLILMSELQLSARVATARNLAFTWGPVGAKDRLDSCLKTVDSKLRSQRNRYVHDMTNTWWPDGDALQSQVRSRLTRPQAFQAELNPISSRVVSREELQAFIAAVEAADKLVTTYIARVMHQRGDHIGVDPETPFVQEVAGASEELFESRFADYQNAVDNYVAAERMSARKLAR